MHDTGFPGSPKKRHVAASDCPNVSGFPGRMLTFQKSRRAPSASIGLADEVPVADGDAGRGHQDVGLEARREPLDEHLAAIRRDPEAQRHGAGLGGEARDVYVFESGI